MPRSRPSWFSLVLAMLGCVIADARASAGTAPLDTVNVNLDSLIDAAAHDQSRFAVNIPHAISSSTRGWSRTGNTSTWTYSVRVPTAVSMSFHASQLALPASAVLTVTTGSMSAQYLAKDINRGGLWSRPLVGDTLTLSLSVDTAEASQALLQIDTLQAGYRGLGGGVADHQHYQRLMSQKDTASSCTQNYSCNATSANQGPAQATVAVLVSDQYQCTGTLLNNARNDATPYVLTARHCQTGKLGGGSPDSASSVAVYWDATTACGQTLQSIYTDNVTQSGAVTVVEQQDAWLIKLDAPPVANDAYYAGWDATGGIFNGGYSIHHALANDKQYVAWYGQAVLQHISASSLQISYNSTFWGVVNQLGNVGAGSSGGALFDPNNNVVGSGTLANLVNGAGTAGVCPATPLRAPNNNGVTAQYTALAGVWTSTADLTSSTGDITLQSVLDPDNVGQMTLQGFGLTPITLTVDDDSPALGQAVTLSWNVAGAQSCTASGGVSGDGWAGSYGSSGSVKLTSFTPGAATYSLTCPIGNVQGRGSASVDWNLVPATTGLIGPSTPVMVGGTFQLSWSANVSPCVASGGVSGDGWAGSKQAAGLQTITASQIGTMKYALSCGTGARAAATTVTVYVVAPYIALSASATQLTVGSQVSLQWNGGGASSGQCVASGGSPSDGWATINSTAPSSGTAWVTESTAGSYTYTLTCNGGGQAASSSVTVVFTSDTPAISLSAVAPQQQIYAQPIPFGTGAPDLLWTSNVSGCSITANGPTGSNTHSVTLEGEYPTGSAADVIFSPGQWTYTLQCGSLQASTTINWVTTAPTGVLTASATRWIANSPYTLSWSSSAGPCTATGGGPGDGWAGAQSASGTHTVTESVQGTYLFMLTCGSGASATQSQVAVIVAAASVSITAAPTIVVPGGSTFLTWYSTLAPCTYLDGSQGAAATATSVTPTGSASSSPTTAGTYLYTVTCGSGAQTAHATVQVTFQPLTVLSASTTNATANAPVTLTWSSPGSVVCIAIGGSGNSDWQGALGSFGTATVTSSSAGTLVFGIACNNGSAQTAISFNQAVTTSNPTSTPPATQTDSDPSSNAVGGSGALDPFWLLLLSLPVALRLRPLVNRPSPARERREPRETTRQ
jgi:lysyl endopeptidase